MQRERSALESFPEPFDLNQGSETPALSWDNNNMLNPVENQLPSDMVAASEGIVSQMDVASDFAQRLSGWDRGESSSGTNIPPEQDVSGGRLGWSSFRAPPGSHSRLQGWTPEPNNISSTRHVGSSDNSAFNFPGGSLGASLSQNGFKSSRPESSFCAGSSDLEGFSGTCAGYSGNRDCPSSSFSTWGSSCKRKALDGGGCSSSNQQMGKNLMQDPIPGHSIAPGNISSTSLNLSLTNQSVQLNPSSEFGLSSLAHGFLPAPSVSRFAESSSRNFVPNLRHGHHNSISTPLDLPRDASLRSIGICIAPPSGHISNNAALDSRATAAPPSNPNNSVNHSLLMHMADASAVQCAGSIGTRSGNTSALFRGERRSDTPGEVAVRSSRRTNPGYGVATGAGTGMQDHVDWSFTPGNSSLRNQTSASRAAPISRARTSALWLPSPVQASQNHNRLSEAAPWNPHVGVESGVRRSHHFNAPTISSGDGASSSRAQHLSDHRSTPSSLDMQRDDVYGWRSYSPSNRRHRLSVAQIRHVLNAMRRGAFLQTEDLMLIDPFLNGFAQFHDRHRDMQLDVDNMSYEELLALEERIGNVSTGLSEDKIERNMKRRKKEATPQALVNLEPCCICQEDYVNGDDIGILDCGHEFHTECIKQWLMLKNICPICKMAALRS